MPLELTTAVIAAVVGAFVGVLVPVLQRQHTDRHRFTDLKRERYSEFLRGIDDQRRQVRYQRGVIRDLERDPALSSWNETVVPLIAVAHDRLAAQRARHSLDR